MRHYYIIILALIFISIVDARRIVKKQLKKELYAYAAFAAVILVYGYLYFSNPYYAILDILNKLLIPNKE